MKSTCFTAILSGLLMGGIASAQDITSFDNGYLSFTTPNTNLYYTVEFRPNLTNESWNGSYRSLKGIQSTGTSVTVPVGRFFRVVASNSPTQGDATGNATAAQVMSGATFSTALGNGFIGTMPIIGQQNITPGILPQAISLGYHNGSGAVAGSTNLVAGNIKNGITLFGVTGTYSGGSTDPRFTDNGDGTVTDTATGLMWIKKPHWLSGNSGTMNWDAANTFCQQLTFAGYSDWRLPYVNQQDSDGTLRFFELNGLGRNDGDIGNTWRWANITNSFTGIMTNQNYGYWSGVTYYGATSLAYFVSMHNGWTISARKDVSAYYWVWPVRINN